MTDTGDIPVTAAEQRAAVAQEAGTWLGTPFHSNAGIKGVGVDCANLIAQTYNNAIGSSLVVRPYAPQWFLHRGEELYINDLLAAGFAEIPRDEIGDGDVVLSRFGRTYCHGGLITHWPTIIHAESRGRKVIAVNGEIDHYFSGSSYPLRFFSWGAWH